MSEIVPPVLGGRLRRILAVRQFFSWRVHWSKRKSLPRSRRKERIMKGYLKTPCDRCPARFGFPCRLVHCGQIQGLHLAKGLQHLCSVTPAVLFVADIAERWVPKAKRNRYRQRIQPAELLLLGGQPAIRSTRRLRVRERHPPSRGYRNPQSQRGPRRGQSVP